MTSASNAAIDAVWRIEATKVLATLTRMTGDVDLAEEFTQDALVAALEQWPESGIPRNAGAWLTAVAKRRAIDAWRRRDALDERYAALARSLGDDAEAELAEPDEVRIADDVLRLAFIACHPVLARPARVALTLRLLGGLSTEQIARGYLVPTPTMAARITRAKRALSAANVPFELPSPEEFPRRIGSVLEAIYLIFNEGYAATSGDDWMRPELCGEALRLGRMLAELTPEQPEVQGLVALMELQASRLGARTATDGSPILLQDQDRTRWDRGQITRGLAFLARADALGHARGPYALQAALAAEHATAASIETTDWTRIVALYDALDALAPSPVIRLNRAVALSRAEGPAAALEAVLELEADGGLDGYHLLPAVKGDLLEAVGRADEARRAFDHAARLTANERERGVLLARAAALAASAGAG